MYIIAVIPLHLFNLITLYTVTILCIIVTLYVHRRKFRSFIQNLHLHLKFAPQSHRLIEIGLVASMFLFSLFVQTFSFNYLIFGSVRDTSIHSLFVQVIMENNQVPETVYPYSTAGIVYPQGHSPIAAYSVFILNYSPPQAIFYLTSLFNALTILGAYFLGKTLSGRWNLSLSLVFVFTFLAFWPRYITWGSNAMVVSFPFYFICLSLFPFLAKEKLSIKTILAIGFLFGYLSVLHLQVYEVLIAALYVVGFYIILKRNNRRCLSFIIISFISLLVLSPFIYRALIFYSYPYHNIGLPADVEIPSSQLGFSLILSGLSSLFELIAVNTHLRIASFALFFVSVLIIVYFRRKERFRQTNELTKLGIATLLGELLIFLFGSFSPYNLPFYPQPLLLYFSFYFFVAVFICALYYSIHFYLSKKILSKALEPELKKRKFLAVTLSSLLFVGIFSPFLYQNIFVDVEGIGGSYSVFSVTTEQDLRLLLWTKENLDKDATILVNTFQSGTFIPSVSNRKVVFPPSAESYSVSYQKLVTLLENDILNATAFDLMDHLEITHVYVGAGVSSWDNWSHKWNSRLFLGNPNFELEKNFGNAFLFQLNYINMSIIFLDEFEYAFWGQNGWQTYFLGNGLGTVTLAPNFGYNVSKCLRINTQVVPTVAEREYARWVGREIFVLNNSRVTLSFYFNATEGFHDRDTFAVMVSNTYRNQSMVLATPNGIYENGKYAISLGGFEGFVQELDLSETWHQIFDSPLPNLFILEIANYDFDGIENVAYIDNITITSTPNT
ncbi:MAG: hypothetical protein OEY22_00735 [Candidatus Bathyarchaeota archaeon]|nr:hypothetical protein [Candidatus Bathyarchaeota archaeon]